MFILDIIDNDIISIQYFQALVSIFLNNKQQDNDNSQADDSKMDFFVKKRIKKLYKQYIAVIK